MSKKKKPARKKTTPRSRGAIPLAFVNVNYVQINVPESIATDIAEALSHTILSDYYRQFCGDTDPSN